MLVAVMVFMIVRMTVLVQMCMFMLMIMRVRMMVLMRLVRMIAVRSMLLDRSCRMVFAREHIHFGSGQAASHHLARLEPAAHIQCCRCVRKDAQRYPGIDDSAQQHVAADAGKAIQVANTHRG